MTSCYVQIVEINQSLLQWNYLPYAAGLLQAYALRHAREPWRYTFLTPFFERRPVSEGFAEISPMANVVGFSCYIWNMNYSLTLAQRLKRERPGTLTVFGGPHVPDTAEDFLRANPCVDVCVHGEGEKIFLDLLEAWPGNDWSQLGGISWLDEQGVFHHNPRPPRIAELDDIPSPYLLDLFAPIMKARPRSSWLAMWETNRGCPFQCSFCDWGSAIASKVHRFGMDRLHAEIEWFARHEIHTIWVCDANFGMLKRDLEITEHVVGKHQATGFPKVFYTQSTKNVSDRSYEIQKMISQAGMNEALTLSLQSTTPEVLKAIKRENISLDVFRDLQNRFRKDSVATYTDILIGLPGETFTSFVDCVARVIDEGQHYYIRYYHLGLLPNAEVSEPEYRAKHGLESIHVQFSPPMSTAREEVAESHEIVIATKTLPHEDWIRCRSLAWWTELVYFKRRLLQFPIVVLRSAGVSYADTFKFLIEGEWPQTVVLHQIREFIRQKAIAMQQGGPENCAMNAPGQGEVWITLEEYLISGLSQSQGWTPFFADAEAVFKALLHKQGVTLPPGVLSDAMAMAANKLKALLTDEPFTLPLRSNVWQVFESQLDGVTLPFEPWQGQAVRDWKGLPYNTVKLEPALISTP